MVRAVPHIHLQVGGSGGSGGATKAPGASKSKTYDLDSKNDQFWDANRFKQWPEVCATTVPATFCNYKRRHALLAPRVVGHPLPPPACLN